jgi:hypothetical protein
MCVVVCVCRVSARCIYVCGRVCVNATVEVAVRQMMCSCVCLS